MLEKCNNTNCDHLESEFKMHLVSANKHMFGPVVIEVTQFLFYLQFIHFMLIYMQEVPDTRTIHEWQDQIWHALCMR